MLGRLRSGVLDLQEIHRFPNQSDPPQWITAMGHERYPGGNGTRSRPAERRIPDRDRHRHMGRRLRFDRRARRVGRRAVSLPGRTHEWADGSRFRQGAARHDLCDHRHPVSAHQHPLPALCRVPPDSRGDPLRQSAGDHPRSVELLAHGQPGLRVHQCDHHATRGCHNAQLVHRIAFQARSSRASTDSDHQSRNRDWQSARRRFEKARAHPRGCAGLPRHRVRRRCRFGDRKDLRFSAPRARGLSWVPSCRRR